MMITEAIQATELSHMWWMEKQIYIYIIYIRKYIYLRISNNSQQKSVLLVVHNSQIQTKNYIGTLSTY